MLRRAALHSLHILVTHAIPAAAEEIAPGVHLVTGRFVPGRQPDGNSVVLRGESGLVIVDTGRHAAHTRAVLDLARGLGAPVVAVVNTHWHLDHTGGNLLVRRDVPGARFLQSAAIVAAKAGFLANYREQLRQAIAQTTDPATRAGYEVDAAILDQVDRLQPDETITASGPRALAGRPVQLELGGPAVTAGDVWVLDLATKTLIAGDLITLPVPFLDTACPSGWSSALGRLAAVEFERVVPGHGPPMTRDQFEAYRASFEGLLRCGSTSEPVGRCADGWIAGLGDLLPATEHDFARRLLDYYVGQVLRGDPAALAARCGG
jgi:glyoxylase-like metal-dependent hydrolase (beta-lactamase superfamily II)